MVAGETVRKYERKKMKNINEMKNVKNKKGRQLASAQLLQ
jgi:hypothetical protein